MKRFYSQVDPVNSENKFSVTLDGKSVRTPGRHKLEMPTQALAEAVADEWRVQGDNIQPRDMPLTQLANTAIDRTRPQRLAVIEQVTAYAETDLLCYRVTDPSDYAQIQAERWQPLLDWARTGYDADLLVTTDVAPLQQPQKALLAIFRAVAGFEDFPLTGLHAATAASGSVVVSLALASGHIDAQAGYELAQLDELYQAEKWRDDPDALARRAEIRDALACATRFIGLCLDTA